MYITDYNIEDVYTSEKDKNSFDYLQKCIDQAITKLVREKKHIVKSRNLYEGVRDEEEFKYLQETFGIETPLALKMTPIVKTRIDVLLGILLDETFTYRVTANDAITIDEMDKQKIEEKITRIKAKYAEQVAANQKNIQDGKPAQESSVTSRYLKAVDDLVNESFISSFEVAAQSLITFFNQDPTMDLKQKVKQYFLDLLVTGEAYYKTGVPQIGADPVLEIKKPENMFMNKNTNHQFMSTGNKPNVDLVVNREFMRREEVLNLYGHHLSKEVKADLFGRAPSQSGGSNVTRSTRDIQFTNGGLDENRTRNSQYTGEGTDYIPVYFVEWLANNEVELTEELKQDMQTVESNTVSKKTAEMYSKDIGSGASQDKAYRLDKYEGIRIGEDIYINCGRSKQTVRSIGNPWQTKLSYNGCGYNERNGKAYSIAWSLKDLQDSFDIIMFFRDNLIANSGVDGSRINLAAIPKVLGTNFMERLLKFMALRKQGVELIDPTEDGANLFQHYGDFKASMNGNVIASLNAVLETIQAQADIVSGVNRHMYSAAEARDAVSNVKVGQQQTSLITKDLFTLVDVARGYMLIDLINCARYAYIKGKRGSYIVGHRSILFSVQAKNFCFTDYDIQVVNSSSENAKIEKLHTLLPELYANGEIESSVLVKMVLADSTSEILREVTTSMNKRKEENDEIGQMTQRVEEADGQNKELQKAMDEMLIKIEAMEKEDFELRNREVMVREKLAESKVAVDGDDLDRKVVKDKADIKRGHDVVQLEREQLYADDAKGNSREIKNNI